ncbi:MAG: Eco57I restriction-modification methylase domain-containing protein [Chitinophagaceae bacterium]|nr:Eco57I restriction-modification methylase domain-containing protein [Chitinophagaceae bacterium]
MTLHEISLKKALNKAYRLVKPKRPDIELFKVNLMKLLGQIDEKESEENVKIHLMDFLKETWYKQEYLVATKGRTDFVIHTGKDAKAPSGVLFEVKRPSNKADMVSRQSLNAKAMHELILYYLRERITGKNIDIRHLVITNIYEWFIFDASVFERLFAKNAKLVKAFTDWESGQKVSTNTDLFYKEIAKPFLDELKEDVLFTWFDIRDYEKPLKNNDKADDTKLIALYKIFSPIHLLKIQFANDSNSLDKGFYSELLHIIGLEEVKEGSKKLIRRKQEGKRDGGSLLENAITILDLEDSLHKVPDLNSYGDTRQDRLFNLSLELCITWINRILFLKLLEAQLIKYHKGDQSYKFLNYTKIPQYDELYKLFFQVLAKRQSERNEIINKKFGNIPYLNSSLFEISELEDQTIKINSLDDSQQLDLYSGTVLRDAKNKPIAKSLNSLQYLFDFLEAYDFASEGAEEIQEDSKTLINASVLGLIFEKINGYKDGSIFTPGFITMYMCREAIRLAVVRKFKDAYSWNCEAFEDLKNYMADRRTAKDILEFNGIINGMHICDPAVGSGHFLVSSLNEIISIKSELGILADNKGVRLSGYEIEIENDELIVTSNEGQDIFEYQVNNGNINKEIQRVQKSLFHEKQTIIENCLFGVDINQNSVKICRLRLWIELLKNAYYTEESKFKALETLPNIDINIKCGNSLISRFALDADLSKALKSIKYNINQYKGFVHDYKNAHDKEIKRGLEQIINSIKADFRIEINNNSKEFKELAKWKGELVNLTMQTGLFEKTTKEKKKFEDDVKTLTEKINKQEAIIEDIKSNAIYRHAFEWRFEFPEVLDNEGNFEGFDVIVGNPPYGVKMNQSLKDAIKKDYTATEDIYTSFIELGSKIGQDKGNVSFIIPVSWQTGDNYINIRSFIKNNIQLSKGIVLPYDVFDDVYVDTGLYFFSKNKAKSSFVYEYSAKDKISLNSLNNLAFKEIQNTEWQNTASLKIVFNVGIRNIQNKFSKLEMTIGDVTKSVRGILADTSDYSIKKIDSTYKSVFSGKLDRYSIDNEVMFVKYGENLKEKPSSEDYFIGERILIRRIISRQFRVMATVTEQHFVNKKDIYVFKLNDPAFVSKYLLAIINSRLISFLKTKASNSAKKDDFTQLTLGDIREIRIPKIPINSQIEYVKLVDKILLSKIKGNETNEFENILDLMIYKLYDLTEDEIKIVEKD